MDKFDKAVIVVFMVTVLIMFVVSSRMFDEIHGKLQKHKELIEYIKSEAVELEKAIDNLKEWVVELESSKDKDRE